MSTLLTGNIYEELNKSFVSALKKSEENRLGIHQEFAAFYNNDYESISEYLRAATLNNPFSVDTLGKLKFRHVNVIKKIISRITSGILTKDPAINLDGEDKKSGELLAKILTDTRFLQKVKEAFQKAVFFNVTEAHVVWDHELKEIRIDIITPNNYITETAADHLRKKAIAVRKADENGEIYWSYWSEKEHYILKNGERIAPVNNPEMKNPYSKQTGSKNHTLPFAALRIEEGEDYYGEPNWNIFLHQKNLDIRLTDLNETELKTLHQIYFGINTNFTHGESFKAGDFKQVNNVKDDDKEPKIESITANVDYSSVRQNIDWHNKLVLNSEGLSAGSSSTELKAESGAAKVIDEIELFEKREEYKRLLYHFMINLLEVIRVVWNYYNPTNKLSEGNFDVQFMDARIYESTDERKKRYDMALGYGYKDEIDITMEELEISEAEAVERIEVRKKRRPTNSK